MAVDKRDFSLRNTIEKTEYVLGNLGKILYTLNPDLDHKFDTLYEDLREIKEKEGRVHIISREGRSGLVGAALGLRLLHFGLDVSYLGDTMITKILPGDMGLCFSGSGTTGDTVSNAKTAKDSGAKLKFFTSYMDTDLPKLADSPYDIFILPGGLRKDVWEYIPAQVGISSMPEEAGHYNNLEEISDILEVLKDNSVSGGGFETLAIIFSEIVITELAKRFNVTNKQIAERHRDDRLRA